MTTPEKRDLITYHATAMLDARQDYRDACRSGRPSDAERNAVQDVGAEAMRAGVYSLALSLCDDLDEEQE